MNPIIATWTGEHYTPHSRFILQAKKQHQIGDAVRLTITHERSPSSHSHFFAALHEAWKQLPEVYGDQFTNYEHFRKWLLIREGYCHVRDFVCDTKEDASRLAAALRTRDDWVTDEHKVYAVVILEGCVVRECIAESQSLPAMSKKRFQESKQAILDAAASLIGVDVETLRANAGGAA